MSPNPAEPFYGFVLPVVVNSVNFLCHGGSFLLVANGKIAARHPRAAKRL